MSAYGNNTVQTVNAGSPVVFNETIVPCTRGLIRHNDGTPNFLLSGNANSDYSGCPCCNTNQAEYQALVKANIAIPTGGTVGEISLALAIEGTVLPISEMVVTPTALNSYFNVSAVIPVEVWNGCCQTITLINTSDQPILVRTPLISLSRPDLVVTY